MLAKILPHNFPCKFIIYKMGPNTRINILNTKFRPLFAVNSASSNSIFCITYDWLIIRKILSHNYKPLHLMKRLLTFDCPVDVAKKMQDAFSDLTWHDLVSSGPWTRKETLLVPANYTRRGTSINNLLSLRSFWLPLLVKHDWPNAGQMMEK